jgi:hypothetical protein
VLFVAGQGLRCEFGEQGFADASWAGEDEAADGFVGIPERGAGAAQRFGNPFDGFGLADDPVTKNRLGRFEMLGFAPENLVDRDFGPVGDDPGDVSGSNVDLALFDGLQLVFDSRLLFADYGGFFKPLFDDGFLFRGGQFVEFGGELFADILAGGGAGFVNEVNGFVGQLAVAQ